MLDETISSKSNKCLLQAEQRESISIIVISPSEEIQGLEQLFTSHDYFNFNPEKVRLFILCLIF